MNKLQTGTPGRGGFFSLFDLDETKFDADVLQRLAEAMDSAAIVGISNCDSGYVYLGQFITHDITERGSLPAGEFVPASELVQLRTPALDLDNVYGDGFHDAKVAVDKNTGKMLLGRVVDSKNEPGSYDDLPRNGLKALIADKRDDENLLIAQLHVQFLKLHNLFVDRIAKKMPGLEPRGLFDEARRNLILCYQDVVLYDYLPAVLDHEVWKRVIRNKKATLWQPIRTETARMPIEFAAAAFRFGHAMVRPSYAINDRASTTANDLFLMTGDQRFGGRPALPDTHIVDWRLFFAGLCTEEKLPGNPNKALRIDPTVGVSVDVPGQGKFLLAERDLSTGNFSMLPNAQDIVRHLRATYPAFAGLEMLNDEELNPEGLLLHLHGLTKKTPLFYYVLCEAYARQRGDRLGPLGSLIVAETLRALIYLSSPSVLHKGDKVLPGIGVRATGAEIGGRRRFRMIDLLKAVGPQRRQYKAAPSSVQPLAAAA
jgi:hypothetical protein